MLEQFEVRRPHSGHTSIICGFWGVATCPWGPRHPYRSTAPPHPSTGRRFNRAVRRDGSVDSACGWDPTCDVPSYECRRNAARSSAFATGSRAAGSHRQSVRFRQRGAHPALRQGSRASSSRVVLRQVESHTLVVDPPPTRRCPSGWQVYAHFASLFERRLASERPDFQALVRTFKVSQHGYFGGLPPRDQYMVCTPRVHP